MKHRTQLVVLLLSFIFVLASCGSDVTKKGVSPDLMTGEDTGTVADATVDMGRDSESDAAPDSGQVVTDMSDAGGCLDISVDSIDFGLVSQQEARSRRVVIENCSTSEALAIAAIRLSAQTDDAFALGSSRPMPPLTLVAGETLELQVQFSPTDERMYQGELLIESNASTLPTRISLSGQGTSLDCPIAVAEVSSAANNTGLVIQVEPQQTVTLDGTSSYGSDGAAVDTYQWTIVGKPEGSVAFMEPSSGVSQPGFFIDVAGTYVFELVVEDAGVTSCGEAATVEVRAKPQTDIHIELIWDTPSDSNQFDMTGTDVDIHYLHPDGTWNGDSWTVYWRYASQTWEGGTAELVFEDRDGLGPEIITHDGPVSGHTYEFGAHYYAENGFGPTYATVRVYLNGELEYEYRDQYLSQRGVFWHAGSIDWGSQMVTAKNSITTGFPQ